MRRIALLLTSMLLTAALLAAGIGTVAADPLNNNRLEVPCEVDGEEYVFVINGEGVAGHIIGEGETGNIIPVQDTVTYRYRTRTPERWWRRRSSTNSASSARTLPIRRG